MSASKNTMPIVSIITPLYNSAPFVLDTINSVLAQTFTEWEWIIIDDCSTDNSVDLVEEVACQDSRIKLIKLAHKAGPAVARNKGIEVARGRYITFLDSDDLWDASFLENSLETMRKNNYYFVFSSYRRTDENLNPLLCDFIVPKRVNYFDLLKTCPISCLTAIYDTKPYGKFYMPNIAKRQDYALWLRILKKVDYAYGIQEPMARYRIRKNSVSRNKWRAAYYQWRIYREIERLPLSTSFYYFFHYFINGLKKYWLHNMRF